MAFWGSWTRREKIAGALGLGAVAVGVLLGKRKEAGATALPTSPGSYPAGTSPPYETTPSGAGQGAWWMPDINLPDLGTSTSTTSTTQPGSEWHVPLNQDTFYSNLPATTPSTSGSSWWTPNVAIPELGTTTPTSTTTSTPTTETVYSPPAGVRYSQNLTESQRASLSDQLHPSGNAETQEYQYKLGWIGFAPGGYDGIYGENTRAAVRTFQQTYGLGVDGILGPQTKNKINELFGAMNPVPVSGWYEGSLEWLSRDRGRRY